MEEGFFSRVAALCKQNKISIKELTEKLNLSSPQIYQNWKTRNALPSVEYYLAIADEFNTTVEYLVRGTERKEPDSEAKAALEVIKTIVDKTLNK